MQSDSIDLIWTVAVGLMGFLVLVATTVTIIALTRRFLVKALHEKKEIEEESTERLRALASRLQSIRENERTHIAREIHDELGQVLTGLSLEAKSVERDLKQRGTKTGLTSTLKRVKKLGMSIEKTIGAVREIATELRPPVLDNLGLIAAIEWQAKEFQTRTGIRTVVKLPDYRIKMSRDKATAIFRIFQETLTNVTRHAKATEVMVEMKHNGNSFMLLVKDNGRGIREEDMVGPHSLGILGMKERALVFGGTVAIQGNQRGTIVSVQIPLSTE